MEVKPIANGVELLAEYKKKVRAEVDEAYRTQVKKLMDKQEDINILLDNLSALNNQVNTNKEIFPFINNYDESWQHGQILNNKVLIMFNPSGYSLREKIMFTYGRIRLTLDRQLKIELYDTLGAWDIDTDDCSILILKDVNECLEAFQKELVKVIEDSNTFIQKLCNNMVEK